MASLTFTRAGAAGTVLAFVVAALCARLGVWQLDRLEQRRARNAAVGARAALPSVALGGGVADTAGLLFRSVIVEGEYDEARSIVLRGRGHRGAPGVHVLTPLRMAPGGVVLVNRGWVPSADAYTVELDSLRAPAGPVRLLGLALPVPEGDGRSGAAAGGETRGAPAALPADGSPTASRRVWTRLDGAALRRQLPYDVASFYVQALPEPGAPELPVRLPPPELDEGPHLGYAVQWFGFATVALVGWAVLVARRGRGGPERAGRGPRDQEVEPV